MDTPVSVLKDTGKTQQKLNMDRLITSLLYISYTYNSSTLSAVVSCVRFLHPHCLCASWPTARTTPPVWSEVVAPSASVLQSSAGHAVRSWLALTS